jgi:Cleft lip and palate transmembrane protein 1 (CLPTM1)
MKQVVQSVAIFLLIQFGMKAFMPSSNTTTTTSGNSEVAASVASKTSIPSWENRPLSHAPHTVLYQIPEEVAPMWPINIPIDIQVYVTASNWLVPLKQMPSDSLIIDERGFGYSDFKDQREINTKFKIPAQAKNNGTIWAHYLVAMAGEILDPSLRGYDSAKAYHIARPLTQMLPKKKIKKTRNLLTAANETEVEEEEPKGTIFASHYHPNFTLSFVPNMGNTMYPSMHPGLRSFMNLERTGARDESGRNGWYYPTLFVNTFWQLKSHMTELNGTLDELPLHVWINNIAPWKFTIIASTDEGMKLNAAKAANGEAVGPGGDGAEFEEFKRILLDSNIYLLSITGAVSILHMFFEFLAFKSDVAHWRKKKDNVGTSFRTILANVFMQAIIFLYLMDNNEHTSWMILFSQGMGIAIEAWKITKTVNVRVRPTPAGSLLPYTVVFEDKHPLSETEKKTDEYDQIAFKYLYLVAIPLLSAYAVYSLIYDTHKSWYSFVITTLVGSVYAYGFLMMVPSLYINYRLQSVAHLPGKAMMYKFLNTFIDDLFAFTIKMPMLHRLATLRDDIIFFVYLYQSWKYKVDYTRINEFGQGGDDDEEVSDKKDAKVVEAIEEKPSEGAATGVEKKSKATKRK